MPSVEELFRSVDDFCQVFEQQWQSQLLSHDLQSREVIDPHSIANSSNNRY